jgi:putative transposase
VDKETEKKLFELGDVFAKCWNEVNYLRRQQFFNEVGVDFATTEKMIYEKYKGVLKVNAQQVARKNAEAWKSFFRNLKLRREGKLPSFIIPKPPGYRKDREKNKREPFLVIRNDRYEIKDNYIYLKDFKLKLEYRGRIHLKGKQGRLEIYYDSVRKRWYAHIPFKVEEKIVRNEWRKIPLNLLGNKQAGIDLGINNLFSVFVENGTTFLVSGRPLKAEAFYWRKKIAEAQSKGDLDRVRKYYTIWKSRWEHYVRSNLRDLFEKLYQIGVSKVKVGYPKYIAKEPNKSSKVNFEITNLWSYRKIHQWIKDLCEEYGMKYIPVKEQYTSKICPLCGEIHKNGRKYRGLFVCPVKKKAMNADLVGAFNILHNGESPKGDSRNGGKTAPLSLLPALAGTLAL